jgi:hypothetical protein
VRTVQRANTRLVAFDSLLATTAASALPDASEVAQLAAALVSCVSASGGLESPDQAHLLIAALTERWVCGGAESAVHYACLQLEGHAPAVLRGPIEAAAARFLASASPRLAALGPLQTGGVSWHNSAAQAALSAARLRRAEDASAPPPRDPPSWLDAMERLCAGVDGGMLGVLRGERALANHGGHHGEGGAHAWTAGRVALSRVSPRVEFYPHFLSDAESRHLLALALAYADGGLCTADSHAGQVVWARAPRAHFERMRRTPPPPPAEEARVCSCSAWKASYLRVRIARRSSGLGAR